MQKSSTNVTLNELEIATRAELHLTGKRYSKVLKKATLFYVYKSDRNIADETPSDQQ